ncbi:MAG: DUF6569 family protein [Candidatus Angelobacter sp.]
MCRSKLGDEGRIGSRPQSRSTNPGNTAVTEIRTHHLLFELEGTTSYAKARKNKAVEAQVESVTERMQKSCESVTRQLRNQNAVGIVVAVTGRILWADMFASSPLLAKYWPNYWMPMLLKH